MPLRQLILLLVPVLGAQGAVSKEAQALADQALGLPSQFAADILLRLAESPRATDPKWKRSLIDDAFLRARSAPALYPVAGDGQPNPGIDALTLETRAVEAMLPLNPLRALTMFRDIPALSLPPLSCQQRVTPDVAAYYQTALSLFKRAFSSGERADGADVAFLRDLFSSLQSPSQVVPALKLLDQAELSPQARTDMAATFAMALAQVNGGRREFAASEPLLMGAAVPEMHESGVLPALRAYIVRQVSGPRCSDQIKTGQLPDSAAQFNKLISRINLQGVPVLAITAEEGAPLKDDGTYQAVSDKPSASALQISEALANAHYSEALRLIEACPPEEDSFRVANRYHALLEQPAGPARRAAVSSALHFLERQYDTMEDHSLWAGEFRLLFPEAGDSADQLLHSRNAVIAAYAALDKLLGPS